MPGKLKCVWGGVVKRGAFLPWHGRVQYVIFNFEHSSQRIVRHKGLGSWQLSLVCRMGSEHKGHSWCDQGGLGSTCLVRHRSFTLLEDIPTLLSITLHCPCTMACDVVRLLLPLKGATNYVAFVNSSPHNSCHPPPSRNWQQAFKRRQELIPHPFRHEQQHASYSQH